MSTSQAAPARPVAVGMLRGRSEDMATMLRGLRRAERLRPDPQHHR